VLEINVELPAELQGIVQKCMERDRGFITNSPGPSAPTEEDQAPAAEALWTPPLEAQAVAAMVVVALLAESLYWHAHKAPRLTKKDTIVWADFDNKAGDASFDVEASKLGPAISRHNRSFSP
jgi:hypothetical protein